MKPVLLKPAPAKPDSIPGRWPFLAGRAGERGLTLIELIVTCAILSILASAALPIARFQVKRQNERELHRAFCASTCG